MTHAQEPEAASSRPPAPCRRRPRGRRRTRSGVASVLQRQGACRASWSLIAVAWLTLPPSRRWRTSATSPSQSSFLAVIALGMTFVIITGGIDLSVGSVYALGGVLAAYGSQAGPLVASASRSRCAGSSALVNGLLVARPGSRRSS